MFCVHCGTSLEDDALFCTACGKAVEEPLETNDASQVPAFEQQCANQPAVASEADQSSGRSSNTRIVIPVVIALVALAVIALIIVFVVLPQTDSPSASSASAQPGTSISGSTTSGSASHFESSSASQTVEPSSSASETSSSSTSASSSSSASAASHSSATAQSSSGTTAIPDDLGIVNDVNARGTINLFLSNFTEVALPDITSGSQVSSVALVRFALAHDTINSPQFIESATTSVTGPAGKTLSSCEASSRIDELASRYFGSSVNYGSLSSDFVRKDNYVYFDASQVVSSPQGVASVTGSEDLGGNRVRVYFNVYSGSYDATNQALYSGTQEEIMGNVGATAPSYKGVAVVRTGGSDDRTGGMTLESFERSS